MRKGLKKISVACLVLVLLAAGSSLIYSEASPVTDDHIRKINDQFKKNGITQGYAALDHYGRIELMGEYGDEKEVDKAFSLAQTVVGVKWVSPVTPEDIKVKEWERRLGGLFSRAKVVKPPVKEGPPVKTVRNRYALIVGVGEFKHGITPLKYSVKDAMSFYQLALERGFLQKDIILLTNEQATRANIAKAFDRIKSEAQEDDFVGVYISSHGTPPDKFGGVHIVTYDTEVKPRERVWYTAITETMFKDFIEQLRARRLVIILDTCYSNGAYSRVPGFLPPGGKSLGAAEDEGYGISKAFGKRLIGAKDIVVEDNVSQTPSGSKDVTAYGKVLISASGAGEKSWESNSLNNSIFTYYFIEGLKKNEGSIKEAFAYSKPLVSERVKKEKGSDIEQTPQVLATNKEWDMRLSRQ